jgi:hypothetical protein
MIKNLPKNHQVQVQAQVQTQVQVQAQAQAQVHHHHHQALHQLKNGSQLQLLPPY